MVCGAQQVCGQRYSIVQFLSARIRRGMEGNLKENGWFLSSEGIAECKKACTKENPTTSEWLKAAANLDLKLYGTKFLPEDLHKGKIDSIKGPGVLQIQKLRNISAPKSNEESNHAPRLLKFQLTDGSMSCQGLEFSTISDISLSTPPGTKICLRGTVPVRNGVLLLDNENTKVLGGEVESLVSKWKLNKSLAKHSRSTASGEDGPPPFVPFSQAKSQDARGNSKGVPNGHGMENDSHRKYSESNRYKQSQQENYSRRGRDRDQDSDRQTENTGRRDDRGGKRGDSRGDSRSESFRGERRYNQDKPHGKFSSDSRFGQKDNRGNKEYRGGNRNSETSNSQSGDSRNATMSGDRNNPRRTDHNRSERGEKPSQSGQALDSTTHQRTNDTSSGSAGVRENGQSDVQSRDSSGRLVSDGAAGGRRSLDGQGGRHGHDGLGRGGQGGKGSSRGGRGGRKEEFGRGRSSSIEQDDSEDYRTRQPSDTGTLWDFVKLSIETPPKTSTPPPAAKESSDSDTKTDDQKEPPASLNDTPQEAQPAPQETTSENAEPRQTSKPQQQQTDGSESAKRVKSDVKPPTSQSGKDPKQPTRNNDRIKDGDKAGRNPEQSTTSRDIKQRQYQPRQQQSSGQGRGRGPRGRHEDGRPYNQTLPPRLQKKQQQQYQQHQHYYDRDRKSSIEKDSYREKTSSPGSGSSGDGRSSQSPSIESGQSSHSRSSDDTYQRHQQQPRRQKGYQKQPRQQSEEYKASAEQKQTSGTKQNQYDAQPTVSGYVSNQPSVQHTHYHVDQHQMYEQQDFNYQQTPPPPPPPPPQQFPVYQMPTQMGPPQAVMVTQPITSPSQQHLQTQIPTTQMRWKKGEQCLALRRDGQYYSAKIEHITPDGQQCMVSFQDFHGGCEMISIASLRPFPIIAWTDSNAQSLPVATTMTAVPVYAQPAQVAMVPRPQVMVPVPAQAPFPMGPKGPIHSQGPPVAAPQGLPQPPPGMQWQPAQMNYQEIRQPYPHVIHYDPMAAQASNPASRPAYYPIQPAGTVQFVRGVKELHGQELYPHSGTVVDGTDPSKGPPSTTVFYNVKPKKTNTRPTQSFYMPPRQQTYGDPAN